MPPSHRIAIYGNSIALAGIAANCSNRPGLDIVAIDADDPEAMQRLRDAAPDVVIFDLMVQPDAPLALFKSLPHVVCVGVDAESDQALVLSGQHATVLSTRDLMELIIWQEPGSAEPPTAAP